VGGGGGRNLGRRGGTGSSSTDEKELSLSVGFWFGNPEEGYYTVAEEKEGH
jgi:hypothetical protein